MGHLKKGLLQIKGFLSNRLLVSACRVQNLTQKPRFWDLYSKLKTRVWTQERELNRKGFKSHNFRSELRESSCENFPRQGALWAQSGKRSPKWVPGASAPGAEKMKNRVGKKEPKKLKNYWFRFGSLSTPVWDFLHPRAERLKPQGTHVEFFCLFGPLFWVCYSPGLFSHGASAISLKSRFFQRNLA